MVSIQYESGWAIYCRGLPLGMILLLVTVEHEMFACMKCSWISRNREILEIFMHANICSLFPEWSDFWPETTVGKLKTWAIWKIRENFMHANCLWPKFAKFSCREFFMFYSISWCLRGFVADLKRNRVYLPSYHLLHHRTSYLSLIAQETVRFTVNSLLFWFSFSAVFHFLAIYEILMQ